MRLLFSYLLLLSTLFFSVSCNDSKKETPAPAGSNYSTAIMVSENGAPPYILGEAQIGESLYRGTRASFRASGKLASGATISLNFTQISITTTGADKTDAFSATLAPTSNSVQASGNTVRNPANNTVSGTFSCTFADGLIVTGTIDALQLQ